MRARWLTILCLSLLSLGCGAQPGQAAPRGLNLGFSADPFLTQGTSSSRAPWIARASSVGTQIIRVNVNWSRVAPPARPTGFDPSDPASPGYDWSSVDGPVRDLTAAGFRVLITIWTAPAWAEAPNPPRSVRAGTWRPSATEFAAFATAAARRYDGSYPDPSQPGSTLPRVSDWQGWNEPNLDFYLAPQWTCARHNCTPVAPALYRQLENSFYAAIKRVDRSNYVVLAGTGPYGDPIGSVPLGQERTPPVAFYRTLFCLRGGGLAPAQCPNPVHLDAVDHHPYGVGGPHWHALNPDDVAVPDIHKIKRVLDAGVRSGRVLPRGAKGLWVTEIGWSSKPPNPKAVPVDRDARWIEQAMYVLWQQGVDTAMLLELGDPAPIPNLESVFESGIYYHDGTSKPGVTAFRFPFVTQRRSRDTVQVWGRAPTAGGLKVEVLARGSWRTLRTLSVGARQVFVATVKLRGQASLRGVLASDTSLPWAQGG